MLNFGASAYLTLLALNPKPRDTEIRKRLLPSKNGYDYYRAMRRIATNYSSHSATWEETLAVLLPPNDRTRSGLGLIRDELAG
jgi:hypothetical protein